MSAYLELDFDGLWRVCQGRTLRLRQVKPVTTFGKLHLRLEEKNGEGVEIEFPIAAPPEVVISGLEKLQSDFLARFPPPERPKKKERKARLAMAAAMGRTSDEAA